MSEAPDELRTAEKQIDGHRRRNLTLRSRSEEKGVDLEEPRPVDFHFWAWTQRDAAVLARGLYGIGCLVKLIAPAPTETDPDRWAVEAGANNPVNQALGDELTEKIVKLASKEDSVFDGWGTSI